MINVMTIEGFKAVIAFDPEGLVILLYTLSQRNRRLGLEWSVMEGGEAGNR